MFPQLFPVGASAVTFQVGSEAGYSEHDVAHSQARCLEVTAVASQQLLASATSGGLPLVLMGASSGPDEVMKGIELGAVDFLEMPISPLKLRNIWQHVVRKVSDLLPTSALLPMQRFAQMGQIAVAVYLCSCARR